MGAPIRKSVVVYIAHGSMCNRPTISSAAALIDRLNTGTMRHQLTSSSNPMQGRLEAEGGEQCPFVHLPCSSATTRSSQLAARAIDAESLDISALTP